MPDTLRRAALAVLVLATVAAGCGPRSVALYEKVMGSPSYRQVTESATRTREVHDGLDTRFILSATWLSKPWVAAFAEEYSNIYYLDTARREQVISRWRQESEKHVLFFVALYVPEEKWNDLEKPGTLWSLRLVRGDEVDFEPAYVRKSSMHPEEIVRFFPYSGTWYRAYEVAFPREAGEPAGAPRAGSPRLKLVLSGVEGRAVL
ncbi:MAG: hypothetical protein A2Z26_05615, partial [Deltaproteobacteria bacterium RBG_16_66_15]